VSTQSHRDERVDQLRTRTLAAVKDLRRIKSNDPAASEAIRVVRLTEQTLELLWLPALNIPTA
jgi:hypothetical protein